MALISAAEENEAAIDQLRIDALRSKRQNDELAQDSIRDSLQYSARDSSSTIRARQDEVEQLKRHNM